ncbi:MAG: hypothetical protein CVV64_02950 [Candidatus Wallbacteria bacterium HGW-Wallbacteria-1]|jgi:anti-anti-sigma factor|uniref:Anti-sigma factor antagonist n=1 Tax=Candidatus Wallbacteria bacterium HGW-Wallbacteria-1 TaxID=2013854 RepID=A0A2N1PTJ8_9BACT|nr:MAG: hypothetical protein CVV64_02950 [Candidatus Wallbacteria bacterium HGW-Wallbacteria-1]
MLKFETRETSGALIVNVEGRIIYETEKTFKDAITDLIKSDKTRIVLNLHGLSYINSAGLGVLINLLKTSKAHGGDIRLCQLNSDLAELFKITNLNQVFTIFDDAEQAVESF